MYLGSFMNLDVWQSKFEMDIKVKMSRTLCDNGTKNIRLTDFIERTIKQKLKVSNECSKESKHIFRFHFSFKSIKFFKCCFTAHIISHTVLCIFYIEIFYLISLYNH